MYKRQVFGFVVMALGTRGSAVVATYALTERARDWMDDNIQGIDPRAMCTLIEQRYLVGIRDGMRDAGFELALDLGDNKEVADCLKAHAVASRWVREAERRGTQEFTDSDGKDYVLAAG